MKSHSHKANESTIPQSPCRICVHSMVMCQDLYRLRVCLWLQHGYTRGMLNAHKRRFCTSQLLPLFVVYRWVQAFTPSNVPLHFVQCSRAIRMEMTETRESGNQAAFTCKAGTRHKLLPPLAGTSHIFTCG